MKVVATEACHATEGGERRKEKAKQGAGQMGGSAGRAGSACLSSRPRPGGQDGKLEGKVP